MYLNIQRLFSLAVAMAIASPLGAIEPSTNRKGLFSEQTLAEPAENQQQPIIQDPAARQLESRTAHRSLLRRKFIVFPLAFFGLTPVAALAQALLREAPQNKGPAVATSFANRRLIFPMRVPGPADPYPVPLNRLMPLLIARVLRFQTMYVFPPNQELSLRLDRSLGDDLGQLYINEVDGLRRDILYMLVPDLLTELQVRHEITPEQGKEVEDRFHQVQQGHLLEQVEFFFQEFLPSAFARFGYYFEYTVLSYKSIPIPLLAVRPLAGPPKTVSHFYKTFSRTVTGQRINMGKSFIRLPYEMDARFPEQSPFQTRDNTDQIIARTEILEALGPAFVEMFQGWQRRYASLTQPGATTPLEETNPVRRAAISLMIRGIQQEVEKRGIRASASLLVPIMRSLFEEEQEIHELVHIDQYLRHTIPPGRTQYFERELEADIVQTLEAPQPLWGAGYHLLLSADYNPATVRISEFSHGADYIQYRGRLGYFDWRSSHQNAPATTQRFAQVPADQQAATWKHMENISQVDFISLNQQVFNEIRQARQSGRPMIYELSNPLAQANPPGRRTPVAHNYWPERLLARGGS